MSYWSDEEVGKINTKHSILRILKYRERTNRDTGVFESVRPNIYDSRYRGVLIFGYSGLFGSDMDDMDRVRLEISDTERARLGTDNIVPVRLGATPNRLDSTYSRRTRLVGLGTQTALVGPNVHDDPRMDIP